MRFRFFDVLSSLLENTPGATGTCLCLHQIVSPLARLKTPRTGSSNYMGESVMFMGWLCPAIARVLWQRVNYSLTCRLLSACVIAPQPIGTCPTTSLQPCPKASSRISQPSNLCECVWLWDTFIGQMSIRWDTGFALAGSDIDRPG